MSCPLPFPLPCPLLKGALWLALAFWGAGVAVAWANNEPLVILDPTEPLEAHWRAHSFGEPPTGYRAANRLGMPWIRAEAQSGTASGLIRDIAWQAEELPWLEWQWHMEQLQPSADIRTKTQDDFGAVVYVLFGTPSLINRHPPTLAYVWSNNKVAVGDLIKSPRPFSRLRFLVLRAGLAPDGKPVYERRDLRADYELAFGAPPKYKVAHIAIWTDSDQTGETAIAYYGTIRAVAE